MSEHFLQPPPIPDFLDRSKWSPSAGSVTVGHGINSGQLTGGGNISLEKPPSAKPKQGARSRAAGET